MSQADSSPNAPVFQLKGSMLAITVLEIVRNDLDCLDEQLAAKVEQAPDFFNNTPLVLALDKLPADDADVDLAALIALCRKHGLRTLAVRAAQPAYISAAERLDMPVLPPSGARERKVDLASKAPAKPAEPVYRPTRVVTTPIRGGQQVYAQGGDLIVLAAVSPGAELLADGNIHVYGPLRGRALAGIKGDANARIFCQQLAAEMVSIAGQYKVAEDLRREPLWAEAVQIRLAGDVLNITRL
ncbi:MAG: septum site-determining protein MinC [Pseudomonas sp.]|uniref:septum site-determining protein MinC n=1 Tax=Stutzerimonas stutzeri group TaxID=136846 RepID=UPI000260230C|nr:MULTISPECIES: septum site-determining protein MinC [Stutzerimonas stutzeri group]EIK53842.1 septum formation inhibitor [Stutzerimonas stutzeri TS44]MEB2326254.1 septum site-determining protein MinC [Pseudomonas sp.]EKM93653.1 septum formation inhibitor [Stutzerimonas degradans]MCF6753227.1 septum site-determining protein MinC [Stutzerimonas stutzeri]MTZ12370.1 septum site-determining protein MinC [Stutzerimonas degradans]